VQDKAQELRRLQQEPAPGGGRCGYEQRNGHAATYAVPMHLDR
jgi:hypothetical protein